MKRLRKIRLINWHQFENETIEIGNSVLLSGENGAGKSTILDAVQFVVTASKANFNKAAHDKGKRTLNTYIRCKTGREDRPYERDGALSAHIALEFHDDAKQRPFIIGAVMDSSSVEKEPNVIWYQMENREIADNLFLAGEQVKSISVFRQTNKGIRTIAPTQREAQKMILSRFGRIESKFFALVPKALAFKPITDIKDFVYSYVLDEKEVKIDVLRENVRSYQDLLRMLEDVRNRIRELEAISEKEQTVESCIRRDRIQEYYIARADMDITRHRIEALKREVAVTEGRRGALIKNRAKLDAEIRDKEQLLRNLDLELNSDIGYQAFRDLEKQEEDLKNKLAEDDAGVKRLRKSVRKALSDAAGLMKSAAAMEGLLEKNGEGPAPGSLSGEVPQRYKDSLETMWDAEDTSEVEGALSDMLSYKKILHGRIVGHVARIEIRLKDAEEKRAETEAQIRELEAKRLVYPENVRRLRSEIQAEFRQIGRKGEVRILCEMLEITDASWHNAVEGYLNTQRFHLLVNPDDFDLALSVYDRLRREKKVYGAGLINTARLEAHDAAPAGSLAEVVTSGNVYARRYINMLLGKVQRCDSYQELKKYNVSITRECMRYQNRVVSAIKPEIFRTPYIGAEAYKVQLQIKKDEMQNLRVAIRGMRDDQRSLEGYLPLLDTDADVDIRYGLASMDSLKRHKEELAKCREYMHDLEVNQNVLQKRIRLEEMKNEKRKLDEKNMELVGNIGGCGQKIKDLKESIQSEGHVLEYKSRIAGEIFDSLGEEGDSCEREYQERSKDPQYQSPEQFKKNYETNRKKNQTIRERAENEMVNLMRAYKAAHDFGAPESLAGYPDFLAEYEKLKNSQLLEFEDKVYRARNAAEEEFREQFLSRLQENIRQAQNEFKDLNKSLKDIHFAREQYEFQYFPKKEHKKYYSMIMDDFNVMEGNSIFSGTFNETHREVIEELFEKLTLDDEASSRTLQEYTDYRTYMDYDIRITSDDGSYMFYSKVSREKSGGETQTPFYITIAASFMQLYKGGIGGDSVGLIMMDEAFNNMDDARIDGVLSFISKSNLQLIVSAPPEKIQYIAPSVDQVLLVLKDGECSYVEDFSRTE
ncbi:MAG: SbcC/MukB-like Walker B domain-containing protein [Lachnospiraceae bacterium]|nr:SbcC/MukB-like Walker B domain-containing protein [Lachnospiraceae bacterium]